VRQPAIGDDASAHAHRIERVAVALRLPVHRPHHAHRSGERVVVALGPTYAAVLVPPDPDRWHVDVEACQHLRVQPTLDLAERVSNALLERAVVDRRAARCLGELVIDALGQLRQLGAQAAQLVGTAIVVVVVIVGSLRRRGDAGPIEILNGIRGNFYLAPAMAVHHRFGDAFLRTCRRSVRWTCRSRRQSR
jgi:hypothetical protein